MLAEQDTSVEGAGLAMRDTLADILQAFPNGLKTLSLETVAIRHTSSSVSPMDCNMLYLGAFWSRAVQAFQVMMSALVCSHNRRLEELVIFKETNQYVQ